MTTRLCTDTHDYGCLTFSAARLAMRSALSASEAASAAACHAARGPRNSACSSGVQNSYTSSNKGKATCREGNGKLSGQDALSKAQ